MATWVDHDDVQLSNMLEHRAIAPHLARADALIVDPLVAFESDQLRKHRKWKWMALARVEMRRARMRKYLILLVPPPGIEPGTPRSTIWCSNQLS